MALQGVQPALRLARMSDREAIEALMRRSVEALCIRDYTAHQIAALGRDFGFGSIEDELILDRTYFVAELQGGIVGCGGWSQRTKLLRLRDDDAGADTVLAHPSAGWAAIRSIFVHPAVAGRGVGRLLVNEAETAARRDGYHAFELAATLTGVPLYRKMAYRTKGLYSFELRGGGRFAMVLMGKADAERSLPAGAGAGAETPAV